MAVARRKRAESGKQRLADAFVEGILTERDWNSLHDLIHDGLERQAFGAETVNRFLTLCVRDEAVRPALRRLIVSDRTWKRRVVEGAPLAPLELQKMTDVGEVVREVRRLYGGDADAAERFLTRPHRRFGGRAPILVAATEGGAQAVRELLARMEEGAPV
jgi:putative toxin-antitoxin system antitoxin component (TIGR02293 family)